MLPLPDKPKLLNLETNTEEFGRIVDLTPPLGKKIDGTWWNGISDAQRLAQPDGSWTNWSGLAAQAQGDDTHVCVACLSASRVVQGAMFYCLHGQSNMEVGLPAVEVLLLASAPWNREELSTVPRYRGTGTALILRAVAHSYFLGLKGRTVLKAKNYERTIAFYTGMEFTSLLKLANGMISMELASQQALARLRSERIISE